MHVVVLEMKAQSPCCLSMESNKGAPSTMPFHAEQQGDRMKCHSSGKGGTGQHVSLARDGINIFVRLAATDCLALGCGLFKNGPPGEGGAGYQRKPPGVKKRIESKTPSLVQKGQWLLLTQILE